MEWKREGLEAFRAVDGVEQARVSQKGRLAPREQHVLHSRQVLLEGLLAVVLQSGGHILSHPLM